MILVLIFSLFFSLFFVVFLYLGCVLVSVSSEGFDKMSPFECGFMGCGLVHVSYSIHFFIMMLMFIFFDLEVVMLLSVVVSGGWSLLSYMILLIFVVFGFYIEWWYGKLIWVV